MDGTDPNYGVLLWATNETQYTDEDEKCAYSSEYTGNTTLRPKMIITYTANDPSPDLAIGEFAYDAYGRLVKQVFWNGMSEIRTYAPDRGWLRTKKYTNGGIPVYEWGGSYDEIGNILSVNDDGNSYDYTYDNLNQLLHATGPVDETYSYDTNGNLTDYDGTSWPVFSGSNRLNKTGYGYDANGNMTTHLSTTVTYDWRNMMTGYGSNTYQYDAYGERVKKTEGGTTRYYVTSGPEILAEYNSSGTLVMEHVYAAGGRIATVIPGNDTYYIAGDQIQSNRTMVDENGNSDQTADFTPYGKTSQKSGALSNYLFSGKEQGSTGLYYFGARYYDPELGRWLSTDPAGQFHSPYVYTGNNPLMYIDEDGEFAWFVPIIIGAFIGGTSGGIIAAQTDRDIFQGILYGATIGALSGGIGVGTSSLTSNLVGNIFQKSFSTIIGGMVGGGTAGYTSGFLNMVTFGGSEGYFTGDIARARQIGLNTAAIGALTGAIGAGLGDVPVKENIKLPTFHVPGLDSFYEKVLGFSSMHIPEMLQMSWNQLGMSLAASFTPAMNSLLALKYPLPAYQRIQVKEIGNDNSWGEFEDSPISNIPENRGASRTPYPGDKQKSAMQKRLTQWLSKNFYYFY